MVAVEALGTIGGVSIALSLVPQVIKTYRTQSAGDISYVYQAIYIFGCTLVNTYAIVLNLWPVYVPCLIEESLIISLTVMKFVYDRKQSKLATNHEDGEGLISKDGATSKEADITFVENKEKTTQNDGEDDVDVSSSCISLQQGDSFVIDEKC